MAIESKPHSLTPHLCRPPSHTEHYVNTRWVYTYTHIRISICRDLYTYIHIYDIYISQRLQCSSFLVTTSCLLRDYNILYPKRNYIGASAYKQTHVCILYIYIRGHVCTYVYVYMYIYRKATTATMLFSTKERNCRQCIPASQMYLVKYRQYGKWRKAPLAGCSNKKLWPRDASSQHNTMALGAIS